ncbi:MAG TPA: COP23 domain-containing protein, partial [Stenomitos sp.]
MKALPVVSVYTLSILASMGVLGAIAPVQAAEVNQKAKFVCGTSQGYPATIALTPRGSVPVVRWSSGYFGSAGFTPQHRCNLVSAKFQKYYENGTLNYLTTGWVNRQPVVCVATQ